MSLRSRERLTTTQTNELDGCARMTKLMAEELERRKQERARYDALYDEYVRQRSRLNASRAFANTKCANACVNGGGVIRYGCDPACTNIRYLNPDLIEPRAPVWGSLGNFVCSSCRQSVNIDANAGDDLAIAEKAVNQQMQCTSELRDAYDRAGASDKPAQPIKSGKSANSTTSVSMMVLIFIVIIALVLVGAIAFVAYIILSDDDEDGDAL